MSCCYNRGHLFLSLFPVQILTHALRDAAGDECAARVDQAYLAMQARLAVVLQACLPCACAVRSERP